MCAGVEILHTPNVERAALQEGNYERGLMSRWGLKSFTFVATTALRRTLPRASSFKTKSDQGKGTRLAGNIYFVCGIDG